MIMDLRGMIGFHNHRLRARTRGRVGGTHFIRHGVFCHRISPPLNQLRSARNCRSAQRTACADINSCVAFVKIWTQASRTSV